MRAKIVGDDYNIHQAAKLAGTSPAVLRMWEFRYGWPRPKRDHANAYRLYSPELVADLRRFVDLVRAGKGQPGDLIRDGLPIWPPTGRATAAATWSCFDQLPRPVAAHAASFRDALERALRHRDMPGVLRLLHEAPIALRPAERTPAAWLPGYFGAREWERLGRPLPRDLSALIGRLAGGPYVVELLRARWDGIEADG